VTVDTANDLGVRGYMQLLPVWRLEPHNVSTLLESVAWFRDK
jgi:hypothetical protein